MLGRPNTALSQIHMQIMWNRLIAVVEEQAQTLVRTAFSTTVREAGDLSAGVFDREAHAGAGGDRHAGSREFDGGGGRAFPRRLSAEDDAAGRPLHHQRSVADLRASARSDRGQPDLSARRPVGLFACTVHVVDIGGRGIGPDGRQVFEEGLSIPMMALAREGRMNEDLLRSPRQCPRTAAGRGRPLCARACNDKGAGGCRDDGGVPHRQSHRLADHIFEPSRKATLEAIGKLQLGTYRKAVTMDGYDQPIDARRRDDDRQGRHPRRLHRNLAGQHLRHQRRAATTRLRIRPSA